MVGLVATAASLALFAGVFPSAGSFLTCIAPQWARFRRAGVHKNAASAAL